MKLFDALSVTVTLLLCPSDTWPLSSRVGEDGWEWRGRASVRWEHIVVLFGFKPF